MQGVPVLGGMLDVARVIEPDAAGHRARDDPEAERSRLDRSSQRARRQTFHAGSSGARSTSTRSSS
jgi:hypothetical protein